MGLFVEVSSFLTSSIGATSVFPITEETTLHLYFFAAFVSSADLRTCPNVAFEKPMQFSLSKKAEWILPPSVFAAAAPAAQISTFGTTATASLAASSAYVPLNKSKVAIEIFLNIFIDKIIVSNII